MTGPRRSNTLVVLTLLVLAAATFSYLGAFAVSDALVSADVLPRRPPGEDPRPGWTLNGFVALLTVFSLAALAARFASRRQLRRIDAMADGEGLE